MLPVLISVLSPVKSAFCRPLKASVIRHAPWSSHGRRLSPCLDRGAADGEIFTSDQSENAKRFKRGPLCSRRGSPSLRRPSTLSPPPHACVPSLRLHYRRIRRAFRPPPDRDVALILGCRRRRGPRRRSGARGRPRATRCRGGRPTERFQALHHAVRFAAPITRACKTR